MYVSPELYEKKHKDQKYLFDHWNPIIMSEVAKYCKGKDVVDLGCGTGIYTMLASKYSSSIIGIDSSKQMLEYAKVKDGSIKFIQGDACHTLLGDKSVDVVLSIGMLEYVDRAKVFSEVHRILKLQGKVIVVCPNRFSMARMPYKVFCKIFRRKYFCDEPSRCEIERLCGYYGFRIIKTVMDDGMVWLPAKLDKIIGYNLYSLMFNIRKSLRINNPFSNLMMFTLEKQD
jgi:SAM-dependent methyltransferase